MLLHMGSNPLHGGDTSFSLGKAYLISSTILGLDLSTVATHFTTCISSGVKTFSWQKTHPIIIKSLFKLFPSHSKQKCCLSITDKTQLSVTWNSTVIPRSGTNCHKTSLSGSELVTCCERCIHLLMKQVFWHSV